MQDLLIRAGCFVAIIVLGLVLRRIGFFKENAFEVLSKIVLKITLPAAIIKNFAGADMDVSLLSLALLGFGGGLIYMVVGYLMHLYHISDPVTYNACRGLLAVYGFKAFLRVFTYVMFCTLKAGGDSRIYNLLDSGIMYTVGIPIAFGGVYLGIQNIVLLVLFCQIEQVVRFVLTLKRYNSYKWANNLTRLVN